MNEKYKRNRKHSNIHVRFVRQIIDGPDRVRGVKDVCLRNTRVTRVRATFEATSGEFMAQTPPK